MEKTNTQLKKKIMRRIYLTFLLRKVFNPVTLKVYTLAVFYGFLATKISLNNVIENMPNITDIGALYNFYTYAFLNTEFTVQVLLVGVIIAALSVFKDVVKNYLNNTFAVWN